jgi:hypothetical protein
VSSSTIHYGQNLYPHQTHDYGEHEGRKKSSHTTKSHERDEVLPFHSMNQTWNPTNGTDYSSHLLSATLPISIQHILKYSESIKKESSANSANSMLSGTDLLGLKNGSNLLGNVASMVNQHHLNHHQHHNFINSSDNNMDHHHQLNIPSHNSMLLNHNQNGGSSAINLNMNLKSPTMVPITSNVVPTKTKKDRKKSVKQPSEKKPKKKKPPKERKPRPKVCYKILIRIIFSNIN